MTPAEAASHYFDLVFLGNGAHVAFAHEYEDGASPDDFDIYLGIINGNADELAGELRTKIDRLIESNPETGEQWAEICRLEALAVELEKQAIPGVSEVVDGFCAKLFG